MKTIITASVVLVLEERNGTGEEQEASSVCRHSFFASLLLYKCYPSAFEPLTQSTEGGVSVFVRTCAIRCPAKRLFVFLVFLLASFLLVEGPDSVRSCLLILGLDSSFRLLGKSFSQPFHVDAEAVIRRRHAC